MLVRRGDALVLAVLLLLGDGDFPCTDDLGDPGPRMPLKWTCSYVGEPRYGLDEVEAKFVGGGGGGDNCWYSGNVVA